MNDLEKAKKELFKGHNCVLVLNDSIYISDETGIKPMMHFIDDKINLKGYSCADKIVGKAIALLCVLCEIKEVYAEVMSESAIEILKANNILYSYGISCKKIINRKGTGICPMEETLLYIDEPKKAYLALKKKMDELNKNTLN